MGVECVDRRFHKTSTPTKIADGGGGAAGASQVLSLDTIYQLNDLIYMVRHGMRHVRAAAVADPLGKIETILEMCTTL